MEAVILGSGSDFTGTDDLQTDSGPRDQDENSVQLDATSRFTVTRE